jgi:hypothetical protein
MVTNNFSPLRKKNTQSPVMAAFNSHTTRRTTTPGNTKGGSIIVPLTSCLTGLDWPVSQIKTKIVSCHTVDSKPE